MKVENIAVSKLIPYAKNTKKHDDKQIANVAKIKKRSEINDK